MRTVGQDRRPGRRRRRTGAGARPTSGSPALETPVDVFLPRYRGVPEPPRIERTLALRVPDPRAPSGISAVTVLDVAGRRLPTATGRPSGRLRSRWLLRRRGRRLRRTTRGGSGCSAAPRSRRSGRMTGRSTCSTSTTGTPGRPRSTATCATPTTRSSAARRSLITLHNLAYHGWTPQEALGQLGLALGDGVVPADADGIDLLLARHRARGARQHRLAGVRRGGPDARVRDGPRRGAARARATASSASSTGSTRRSGTRPPTPTRPRRTRVADRSGKAACRADLLTRSGSIPTTTGRSSG